MSNKIQIKRGSKAPGNGVLDVGELGYDTVDKAFYIGNGKDSNGTNLAPTKFKPSEINLSEYEVTTHGKYLYPFFGLNTSGYQTTHTGKNLYLYCGPNYSYLSIGNSTHLGAITLHKGNSWYTNIVPNDLTSNITITLPSEGGTLLTANNLTKTIVTNALGYTPPSSDTNTTYTFTSGDSNGQIKVSPSSGSAYNVSVKGLGSAAYTNSSAYASASSLSNYLPLTGGTVTGQTTFNSGIEIPSGYVNVSNGSGLRVKGTDGAYKKAVYLNNANNLHIGNYDNDNNAHGNNTWLNAAKGSIGMKCSTHEIYFSAYAGDTIKAYFRPHTHNKDLALGSSNNPWYRLYAVNATTVTSDRREKSDINYIADYPVPFRSNGGNVFENFFDNLQPATFGINSENADNFHIGFIAQEIEEAAAQADLPVENLGLLVHEYWTNEETGEEEDVYCLGYEEFIALNTYMIQKLKTQVREQQNQIEELKNDITKLKQLINTLTQ